MFVNRDQLTGFGTPWEIRFQANYTVLRKGGNVDGYSALLSYVPDLKLGMYVHVMEYTCTCSLTDMLGPAVCNHLVYRKTHC